jgi:tRNA pseudouridine55 synthase
VIRDLQKVFRSSQLFKPALEEEERRRDAENERQKKKRRGANRPAEVKMGHGGTLDPMASMEFFNFFFSVPENSLNSLNSC